MNNYRQGQRMRCLVITLMFLTMIPAWANASITLSVNAGWSLLSSTIGLQVTDVFGDMQKFISVWKWTDDGTGTKTWAVYLPGGDGGAQYAQSKGYITMTSIASGEGFWVNSASDQQVVVNGTPSYGELSFFPGWNLVGIKGVQPLAAADLGAVTSVWKWTTVNGAITWAVYLPGEVSPGAYAAAKGFGQLTTIQPSEGFWVNLPEASATTTTSTTTASSTTTTTTTTLPASLPAGGITVPASDDDGDYTVSWMASATSGVTYVLEEATDESFSTNLREAYSGIHEYAAITARQAGTTYFYRVKATKIGYNDSGWLTGDNGCLISTENPALTLMVATDTNAMSLAWLPGSDGITPVAEIVYEIHLSTQEQFSPSSATLVKTVTGEKQATVDGLTAGTQYYGVVVALFSGSQKSAVSNSLQARTSPQPVAMDPATVVATAADLGLGTFTTTNNSTYLFQSTSGTPPAVNSVLVAEDGSGGMTLRRVTSASKANGEVTVETTAASLTDVFDTASLSTSFKLVDVQQPAQALGKLANKQGLPLSKSMVTNNGSLYSRIDWEDRLLSVEQTNYAYDEPGLTVVPLGKTSTVTLHKTTAATVSESFTANITANFNPSLITEAEWGGAALKSLNSAKVAAKGTLSLAAQAAYHFSAAGSTNQEFTLFEKNWSSLYLVGGVPVLQKVTLTMKANAKANAEAQVDAKASALIVEEVEVGAIYNGTTWTPYIVNDNGNDMKASLDIVGKASAEIRLIPEVKVTFYEVLSSSLTVEPLVGSSLTFAKTTDNLDFLTLHPERLIQLTSFDAALGMESNVLVNLNALGGTWNVLPKTCVLGSGATCLNAFAGPKLFSLPKLAVTYTTTTGTTAQLLLQVTDGVANAFDPNSVQWEVFPNGAIINPGLCNKANGVTTCGATLTFGDQQGYAVFASGQGILGTVGRQFKEVAVNKGPCQETIVWQGREWQRCGSQAPKTWEEAKGYCAALTDVGYDDWFLPSIETLRSLIVCSNGTQVTYGPDNPSGTTHCGAADTFDTPAWYYPFKGYGVDYWSSNPNANYPLQQAWAVDFGDGRPYNYESTISQLQVRCVRGGE